MSAARAILAEIQAHVAARNDERTLADYLERASVEWVDDAAHVYYFGEAGGAYELLEVLTQEEVAKRLASLTLDGPDQGANGTQSWNLETLLAGTAYPQLRCLHVRQVRPGDHNQPVLGDFGDEGTVARLVEKTPQLESLRLPSAPSPAFFDVGAPALRFLNVNAGYDTQNFILNLGRSTRLPALRYLEFGEYNETYMDEYRQCCTPFEHYRELFESPVSASLRGFVWRHPICTAEQIEDLQEMRPQLRIKVVRWSHDWL